METDKEQRLESRILARDQGEGKTLKNAPFKLVKLGKRLKKIKGKHKVSLELYDMAAKWKAPFLKRLIVEG